MKYLFYLDEKMETQAIEYHLNDDYDLETIIIQLDCEETEIEYYLHLLQCAVDSTISKLTLIGYRGQPN